MKRVESFATQGLGEALKRVHNKSVLRFDGFTTNFYNVFCGNLKTQPYDSFTQSMEQNELSISKCRGLITLIQKGHDTAKEDTNKWTPITATH